MRSPEACDGDTVHRVGFGGKEADCASNGDCSHDGKAASAHHMGARECGCANQRHHSNAWSGCSAVFAARCRQLHMPEHAIRSWIVETSQPQAYCLSYFICTALHSVIWMATYLHDLSFVSGQRRVAVRTSVLVSCATDLLQMIGLFLMGPLICRCATTFAPHFGTQLLHLHLHRMHMHPDVSARLSAYMT